LLAYALTVLGLRRNDFDWLTPAQFTECMNVYAEKKDQEARMMYELARFNGWLNLSPHMKKNTSQQDLVRFEWEELQTAKVKVCPDRRNIKS